MRSGYEKLKTTHWRCLLYARQNEVNPNQANTSVKQIAAATRFATACPARYFEYSRTSAAPPNSAMERKTVPVTSSHSWCAARPKERPAVRTAPQAARTVRLRPTWLPATRAATPNFRKEETLLTALDFNSLRRYNDATSGPRRSSEPLQRLGHLRFCGVVSARGASGSATQTTHEGTRRRH